MRLLEDSERGGAEQLALLWRGDLFAVEGVYCGIADDVEAGLMLGGSLAERLVFGGESPLAGGEPRAFAFHAAKLRFDRVRLTNQLRPPRRPAADAYCRRTAEQNALDRCRQTWVG